MVLPTIVAQLWSSRHPSPADYDPSDHRRLTMVLLTSIARRLRSFQPSSPNYGPSDHRCPITVLQTSIARRLRSFRPSSSNYSPPDICRPPTTILPTTIYNYDLSDRCYPLTMTQQWASEVFGFLIPGDSVSMRSSIMPQKKNPDPMELVRENLCENNSRHVEVSTQFALNITLNHAKIGKALPAGYLDATTLADHLVKKGVPFRTSHDIVGRYVSLCVSKNRQRKKRKKKFYKKKKNKKKKRLKKGD
ncbi:hypothetical protein IEQ34_006033 [Dendrobium chrysotoxum]|uniref:Argininosuccinate lyase C-terminal domain-containing protein n=1 Tax=Dendrobium chrysotoxum TaxID=161865 RepID=A0AAV7GVN4_DENCH|nr:hypothetical protein IEQ34_006033 [Dendrobium chrysotoxum]